MAKRHRTHNPMRRIKRPDERPSAGSRGYGRRWRERVRLPFLKGNLDGRPRVRCDECGTPFKADWSDAHVDHVVALADGGENRPENFRALCHRCHSRKTVAENGGFGRARNPAPADPDDPDRGAVENP